MKKCMYCLEDKVALTREHVIPSGLLDMYPSQDVTYNTTTYKNLRYKDNDGLTIKDVCQDCNNNLLSPLDSYGKNMISKYFSSKFVGDPTVIMHYDYHLLQRWLLKIAYNVARSSGLNFDWFRDELDYILHNIQEKTPPVSIFGGLHVDMTAFGEDKALLLSPISSFKPLYVYHSPRILQNGVAFSMKRKIPIKKDLMKIRRAEHVFTIRFGSAMFLLFLWNKPSISSAVDKFNDTFEAKYPYTLFREDRTEIALHRVTDSINCFQPGIIQSKTAMMEADEGIRQVLGGRTILETQAEWDEIWSEEKQREGRLIIDRLTFPDNKSIEKEYNNYFAKKHKNQ
ncbi:hypothetical protein B5M42_021240 [Paenibacillus athensensis]|uniref:HNH endonuclease n=1 Tax=Paenibacillus athensensis TaxID=1967502 RepID=A0A4Y8Q0L1_9BACL|nr:hypothetical protein [Paenibacillus athensensis]MCD1261329.1 hypothetical protein [Paenibacillus athensensis]